jgi:hypothetical protein
MDEDLKREFDQARLKHILFKARLRSFLYGHGSDEAPVRDPDECSLGHWIRDVALARYGYHPEAARLDQLHRRVHEEAGRLMDLHAAGQGEEALRGLRAANPLTDEVLQVLNTLEQKLRKEAR